MNYCNFQVVLQEVPGEVSLCFSITGCPLKCKGCHSPFLWKRNYGIKLTKDLYRSFLDQYKSLATCVLFMGGEWHEKELVSLLKLAKKEGYKRCLYTGENTISYTIKRELDWLKTGEWNPDLGGLTSPQTNQKFIELKTNKLLNNLFIKNQNS